MQTSSIHVTGDIRVPNDIVPVPKVKAEKAPEPKQVESGINTPELAKLKAALSEHNISLKFSRDDATKRIVVEMIDQKTGDAIRQFPTEVSLSLAANFMKLQGVFLNIQK
ncbi:MAG: flagellar protein FlaG [Pyrinomonadaceae bacterium]